MTSPTRLRVEHGPRPLGIGFARPRLSWWLPAGASGQQAYRVQAEVDGALQPVHEEPDHESTLRPWPYAPLDSRSEVRWRVQVRGANGWSDWSELDEFETGLLDVRDWRAHFIGEPPGDQILPRGERPALYLQRTFQAGEVRRARLYATANGIYELHLDGERIGDLELTPGFTAYRTHLEVQTYDLTALLAAGEHQLTATVTDGWWRGSIGNDRADRCYGDSLALLAQLEITSRAGSQQVIVTDESWQVSSEGPIRAADLIEGERVDLRIAFPPDSGWSPARPCGEPDARLTVSPAPPTRRVEHVPAARVTRLDGSRQVVDLGKNINGWVRLDGSRLGPPGNRVTLRHAEMLGPDGDVDLTHLQIDGEFTSKAGAGQVDEVISAGERSPDFEPRHTTHGFQYVGVEGADDLDKRHVTGRLVHTDLARTGWFRCSDDRINAFHEATVLSFRDNVCEIPTDCPQRERSGWTGDWQLFSPTASFLYDIAGLSTRWLRDLAADQWPDGRVPNIIPEARRLNDSDIGYYITGSAGWGDAAVLVPYQVWQAYGDRALLEAQYDSMQRWVAFALDRAKNQRHPRRVASRPEPAAHEEYLWDIGFHWGEWLEPGVDMLQQLSSNPDFGDVATAFLFRSLSTLADIAHVLGRDADEAKYRELAARTRAAWQAEYVAADGSITPLTQANLVRALAFGLVGDAHRERVAADLVDLIEKAGNHLGTGFLATPFLLPALADSGHLDVAYQLLLQTTPPSWLAMTEAGSTTVWENWEGLDGNGKGSLNHYSKGAVVTFLHEYVAGLRPIRGIPAYRRFQVIPRPGGGLTSAEATLHTPYGPISSSWRLADGRFDLDVRVAPGTLAEVTMPDGTLRTGAAGSHHFDAEIRNMVR